MAASHRLAARSAAALVYGPPLRKDLRKDLQRSALAKWRESGPYSRSGSRRRAERRAQVGAADLARDARARAGRRDLPRDGAALLEEGGARGQQRRLAVSLDLGRSRDGVAVVLADGVGVALPRRSKARRRARATARAWRAAGGRQRSATPRRSASWDELARIVKKAKKKGGGGVAGAYELFADGTPPWQIAGFEARARGAPRACTCARRAPPDDGARRLHDAPRRAHRPRRRHGRQLRAARPRGAVLGTCCGLGCARSRRRRRRQARRRAARFAAPLSAGESRARPFPPPSPFPPSPLAARRYTAIGAARLRAHGVTRRHDRARRASRSRCARTTRGRRALRARDAGARADRRAARRRERAVRALADGAFSCVIHDPPARALQEGDLPARASTASCAACSSPAARSSTTSATPRARRAAASSAACASASRRRASRRSRPRRTAARHHRQGAVTRDRARGVSKSAAGGRGLRAVRMAVVAAVSSWRGRAIPFAAHPHLNIAAGSGLPSQNSEDRHHRRGARARRVDGGLPCPRAPSRAAPATDGLGGRPEEKVDVVREIQRGGASTVNPKSREIARRRRAAS